MAARRWHRPSWFAVLLTVAGVLLFVRLGVWQLHRAAEKERLFAAFAGAAAQPTVDLDATSVRAGAERYPHVRAAGRYDPVHAYVLDDQVHAGRDGVVVYDVFLPVADRRALLVDRGFLARTAQGAEPPIPSPPTGERVLTGLYAPPPGNGLRLGGDQLPNQQSWPKRTIYIDLEAIGRDLGRSLDTHVLLLDPDPVSGFVREWTPEVMPPVRHRAYALQWFTFALAALVIFIVLHWRSGEKI